MPDEPQPSLQVDSDWKAQAQAEKERLTQAAAQKKAQAASAKTAAAQPGSSANAASGAYGGQEIPPASFEVLVSTIATQALYALGGIPDPRTGQRTAHLELARHHIDLLAVLQEKTNGNLSDQENTLITQTLYQLRQRYIQLATEERNG